MKDLFEDMPLNAGSEMPGQPRRGFDKPEDYLSMGEYEELRLLLTSAQAAFAEEDKDITPDPRIQKNLRALVAARREKKYAWPQIHVNISRILNFPVPAYQFGLTVAMLLLAVLIIGNRAIKPVVNTVIVHTIDTIYEKQQKKLNPTIASAADSEAKMMRPRVTATDPFTDTINLGYDDDSDFMSSPAEMNNIPVNSDVNGTELRNLGHPHEVADPADKGGAFMEDSSKWHHYRGLL